MTNARSAKPLGLANCSDCFDAPPAGFSCLNCGAGSNT